MTIHPLRSPASLVDQLCEKLSTHLQQMTKDAPSLLPPERVMAKDFGVSRSVFREAAKRLELQGLIEIRHGSGMRAIRKLHKPISASVSFLLPKREQRLHQLTVTRSLIEPALAASAAQQATPSDIRSLKIIHADLESADTTAEAVLHDIAFHRQLAVIAQNQILLLLLDSLAELGQESREITLQNVGTQRAIEQHRHILAAIEARDGQAAHAAMTHHLASAANDLNLPSLKPTKSAGRTKNRR